jgi:hypothetical protein
VQRRLFMQSNERPYGKEKQADRTIKANHELLQLAVARTILCLGAIALVAVALRFGVYEYFRGDGRILRGLSELLRQTGRSAALSAPGSVRHTDQGPR